MRGFLVLSIFYVYGLYGLRAGLDGDGVATALGVGAGTHPFCCAKTTSLSRNSSRVPSLTMVKHLPVFCLS